MKLLKVHFFPNSVSQHKVALVSTCRHSYSPKNINTSHSEHDQESGSSSDASLRESDRLDPTKVGKYGYVS